jgi:MFS family permease
VSAGLVPALVLTFRVAAASQSFITMASALYNTYTPADLRGRVMGLATVIVQGGSSLGALLIGGLGAAIGVGAALACGGTITAGSCAAVLARVRALRNESTDSDEIAAVRARTVRLNARP